MRGESETARVQVRRERETARVRGESETARAQWRRERETVTQL